MSHKSTIWKSLSRFSYSGHSTENSQCSAGCIRSPKTLEFSLDSPQPLPLLSPALPGRWDPNPLSDFYPTQSKNKIDLLNNNWIHRKVEKVNCSIFKKLNFPPSFRYRPLQGDAQLYHGEHFLRRAPKSGKRALARLHRRHVSLTARVTDGTCHWRHVSQTAWRSVRKPSSACTPPSCASKPPGPPPICGVSLEVILPSCGFQRGEKHQNLKTNKQKKPLNHPCMELFYKMQMPEKRII